MNTQQLFNMIVHRLMSWGVNKGLKQMSQGKRRSPDSNGKPRSEKMSRDIARKMRMLARLMRR